MSAQLKYSTKRRYGQAYEGDLLKYHKGLGVSDIKSAPFLSLKHNYQILCLFRAESFHGLSALFSTIIAKGSCKKKRVVL
jgi:hypothetical protein